MAIHYDHNRTAHCMSETDNSITVAIPYSEDQDALINAFFAANPAPEDPPQD